MSDAQKLVTSISGSLVGHLLLMVLVFLHLAAKPRDSLWAQANDETAQTPSEISVRFGEVMKNLEVENPDEDLPDPRSFVNTDGSTGIEEAPEGAAFESDKNTVVSSNSLNESPGQLEEPQLDGDERISSLVLESGVKAGEQNLKRETESAEATQSYESDTGKSVMRVAETEKKTNPADEGIFAEGVSFDSLQSKVDGSQSERQDENAVNAEATPMGKYKKAVTDAISKEWHRLRAVHGADVTWGTLRLRFDVTRVGKVANLKITENKASALLVEFTVGAILDAKIPKMPEDVASEVSSAGLEMNYDVIIY